MNITPLVRRARVGLSASGPVVAAALRLGLQGRKRKLRGRIIIAAILCALPVFVCLAIFQTPVLIAEIATAGLFGAFDSSDVTQNAPPDDFCLPIPQVAPTTAPMPPADDDSPAQDSEPSAAAPEDAVGPDGKPTPAALAVIVQIPAGADADVATGWVLFRLAHPADTAVADYRSFADAYASTRASMSPQASALDVVATMDPTADYAPFLLLAQAAIYRQITQGTVSATDEHARELTLALATTCAGPDHPDDD